MIKCAIVGATGLVGSKILDVIEERNLKIDEFTLFASSKSKGKKIDFLGKEYVIQELNEDSFTTTHFDYALFAAGGNTSRKFVPIAVESGCIVIDNSSEFRMDKEVPLVVPEVNSLDIFKNKGIISNPNCSTIQAVVCLKPLLDKYGLKKIIYSTYQAVSGAGISGINDYYNTSKGKECKKFPYTIYNNCIPHIDVFLDNEYTKEEMKMINETKKILKLNDDVEISATCVRVPVLNCHGESIYVELEKEFEIDTLKQYLSISEGIVVLNDITKEIYPINTFVDSKDEVFVGRIRKDYSNKKAINMWVVADNIRKGAATNAVQILEILMQNDIM